MDNCNLSGMKGSGCDIIKAFKEELAVDRDGRHRMNNLTVDVCRKGGDGLMGQNKRMPVGIEDYGELVERCYFVDKTRLIKELLDSHSKVTLITRPRRFGKTLAMSMLAYFFATEKAEKNRALFSGSFIEQAGASYMAQQGRYPVIFLTLKDMKLLDFSGVLRLFRLKLSDLYGRYLYLADSQRLTPEDKSYFRRIRDTEQGEIPSADMALALEKLSVFLWQHHQAKPVILIDEYDAPLQQAWENGFFSEMISFLRIFLGAALKTNPALEFSVLTGVLRIAKESIFSDLNNLDTCSVLSGKFADCFGFTEEEVQQITDDLGIPEKMPELRNWYDGYRFGETDIYNPWSVINYIQHDCQFAPYWVNTSENVILHEVLYQLDEKRRMELDGLIQGKPVKAQVQEGIIYEAIGRNKDALYTMLLTTGYLKSVSQEYDEDGALWCRLLIPNREVRSAYRREILAAMTPEAGSGILYDLMEAMVNGQEAVFEDLLKIILLEMASVYDTARPESFYHGMMLGFSVLLAGRYDVSSNHESGYERFDLALFPLSSEDSGVLMEFKVAESEADLIPRAREALAQIDRKAYMTEFKTRKIVHTWQYGIAFSQKQVKILRRSSVADEQQE